MNAYKADSYGFFLPTIWYLDALKSRVETSIKSAVDLATDCKLYSILAIVSQTDRYDNRTLLPINLFLKDTTDRINHTQKPDLTCTACTYTINNMNLSRQRILWRKFETEQHLLIYVLIVMCVLILLNEREVYSILLPVVGRCTFKNGQRPSKKNCCERSWTYMMETCCLFTVLTKFLDCLFSSSLQSWVKRIESISLQSLKQRRMGTSPVKSFELFFELSCF